MICCLHFFLVCFKEPIFKFVGFVQSTIYFERLSTLFFSFAEGDKALYHFCDGNVCGNTLKVPVFRWESMYLLSLVFYRLIFHVASKFTVINWNMCTSKHYQSVFSASVNKMYVFFLLFFCIRVHFISFFLSLALYFCAIFASIANKMFHWGAAN